MREKFKIKDYYSPLFVILIILGFYIASYYVDIKSIYGIRDWMVNHEDFNVPFLWNYLFSEGAVVGIMRWSLIGLFTITSAYNAGMLRLKKKNKEHLFWLLFAILGILMIMEDAGRIRHFLTTRFVLVFWDKKTYQIITEIIYFSLMASVPVIALLKYGKYIFRHKRTGIFLFIGCALYGIAAFMNATRDIMYWFQTAGDIIYHFTVGLGGPELEQVYEQTNEYLVQYGYMTISYRFMDALIEDTIEVIAISFLWASALSYRDFIISKFTSKEGSS
ncbi:MAG: hypothetical protein ACOCQH_00670 [Halanaerobiales bacterium]